MLSAAKPARGKGYSDSVAENAVVGTITTGLFTRIPCEKLIPVNAFTDEKCRIIYAAALSLHQAGAIVTPRAVNELLALSGASKRLNKLLDDYNLSPESWKLWDHEVDRSLACAPTTLPVEDSLAHLRALHANREDLRIGQALTDGTLSGAQAIEALAALHRGDGRSGDSAIYTVRDPEEILALQFSPDDILLSNGYVARGDSTTFCGAPGVGKSRLSNQLAICCALGLPFLGWETTAMDARWLFMQSENGNRRLQADLSAMLANLTNVQRQMVKDALAIHTLENEEDGIMFLSNERAAAGIRKLIQKIKPDIVVFDPLRDFAIGDLNTDGDMAATLAAISRITREGNPRRIPFIIHHALTGKAGIAKAVGIDRGSFGRNSKVLAG
jgi:hypothetical protein